VCAHLVRADAFNAPITSCPSRVVGARHGRGGCTPHGREKRMVEAGRISYGQGGRGRPWALGHSQLSRPKCVVSHAVRYPGYVLPTDHFTNFGKLFTLAASLRKPSV
jgi:hypothetical protein